MSTLVKKYAIQVFGQLEYSTQTTYSVLRTLDEGEGLFDSEEEALSYMIGQPKPPGKEPWFAIVPVYKVQR